VGLFESMVKLTPIAILCVAALVIYYQRKRNNDIENYSLDNFPIPSREPDFDIVEILDTTSSPSH
jgi:hypothetical protein